MTTMTATELKSRLGEAMDTAQREPVMIEKQGRRYAVLISREEWERFQALEDRFWAEKATRARESGYLTPEETLASLRRRLDAGDTVK